MKDTKQVMAMLEKAKHTIIEKRSCRTTNSDAFVIFMKRKGYGKEEVFAHNWNGDRENLDKLFDATQLNGWYLSKISMRCRYTNYTDMTIYLEQSKDGFTTNVDVDVIDALKEMTSILVGFKPDPAKIEARDAEKQANWGCRVASALECSRYGNEGWSIIVDGCNEYSGWGYEGANDAVEFIESRMNTHRLSGWQFKANGYSTIYLTEIKYGTPTNLTASVINRMKCAARYKGVA